MPYVEIHSELTDHPKMRRLKLLTGVSPVYLQAHLCELWKWTMLYAPSGDLTKYDAIDIAAAAAWEGDPRTFYNALAECGIAGEAGFLRRVNGKVLVNDWHHYGGRILITRFSDRFRKERKRSPTPQEIRSAGLFPEEMWRDSDIPEPVPAEVVPIPTEPQSIPEDSDGFRVIAKRSVAERSVYKQSVERDTDASSRARDLPPIEAANDPPEEGTYLPDGWLPSQDDVGAVRSRFPRVDLRLETEKFRLHYARVTGKSATSRDWHASWRAWMLRSAKEYPPDGMAATRGSPNGRPRAPTQAEADAEIRQSAAQLSVLLTEHQRGETISDDN
jgi:hypothetical protein